MRPRNHHGSALVTALSILMVLFITGAGVLSLSIQALRRSTFDAMRTRTIALADAGVEKAIYYLRTTAPDGTVNGSWRTTGRTESMAGLGEYTMIVEDGTGPNSGKIIVTSTGKAYYSSTGKVASNSTNGITWAATNTSPSMKRTLRVVIKLNREDVSVWNNAVFGGVGQNGRSVNGNVRIRGSVHLLGDGEPWSDLDGDKHWDNTEPFTDTNGNGVYNIGEPFVDVDGDGHRDAREPFDDVNGNGICDPPLTVTDLSSEFAGDANIGNNYSGMPSVLRNLLPNPPTTTFNGEVVETLNAKLRAKHGFCSISGSATVGDPNASGGSPAVKETMDGVFVNDGFGGNQGAAQVYSDNGTKLKYELGDGIVKFPKLTDPVVKNGISYSSYMAYLKANALVITGDVTLRPQGNYPMKKDNNGNSLQVDGSGRLRINGIVYVTGNIYILDSNGNKDLRYDGRGTLVSEQNIYINTDLLPYNGNFPIVHAMGFIARHRLELATQGGGAQLNLAGAYYAQEQIVSTMQNEIGGTFVSSYYAMQNVPHMYQVPTLPDNLPPGMPGSGRIWVKTVRVDSWREMNAPTKQGLSL